MNNHIYTTHVSQDDLRHSSEPDPHDIAELKSNLEGLAYTYILEEFAASMKDTEADCDTTTDNLEVPNVHIQFTHMSVCPPDLYSKIFECDFCSFSDICRLKGKELVAFTHALLKYDQ